MLYFETKSFLNTNGVLFDTMKIIQKRFYTVALKK